MADWRVYAGVLAGLAATAAIMAAETRLSHVGTPDRAPEHGPMLSECDGTIEEVVIQYVPEAAGIVETVYREFLRQLPSKVTVHVVCPDKRAFDDLSARVGPVACNLVPVTTNRPMTCWSRDRWVAFEPRRPGGPAVLLAPMGEAAAGLWPQRKGDEQVASEIAKASGGRVLWHRSVLGFDGGDFTADSSTVFVTPQVALRNVGHSVESPDELVRTLAGLMRRKVVLMTDAPRHHAGMFMMFAGDRTVLVGDPSLAKTLLNGASAPLPAPNFSAESQARFDAVARCCSANGYRVVRIPLVPDADERTYLTYVNVIIDERDGERTVYMPVYQGAEVLNRAAADCWRGLGYRVRPVDCTQTYRHFGNLHCLVNVLRRSAPGQATARNLPPL